MQGRVLDGSYVSGWERRQVKREEGQNPESHAMSAAERKRKQRERQRQQHSNGGVTNGHDESRKNTLDKDTDKDTDKDLKTHMFETAWIVYPKRSGSNPKKHAMECWNARVAEGISPEQMILGTQRYRAFCDHEKITGTKFVMQAQRFFGTGREFENDWSVPFDPLITTGPVDTKIPFGFRGYTPDQET
ncbi:hypothetical protein CUC45_08285 [Citrobacter freundii]|nr:hypothetical protein CUC45_08285 [Citrobacter freundii]